MTKVFFTLAIVAALTLSLASCKKDRTCTCTDASGTEKMEFEKVTKKTVRDEYDCVSYTSTYTPAGGTASTPYTVTCEIE